MAGRSTRWVGRPARAPSSSGTTRPPTSSCRSRTACPPVHVEFSRDSRWIVYVLHPEGEASGGVGRTAATGGSSRSRRRWRRCPAGRPTGAGLPTYYRSAGERWRKAPSWRRKAANRKQWASPARSIPPGLRMETKGPRRPVIWGLDDRAVPGFGLIDLRTGQMQHTFPGSEGPYSPRWSPDGRSILTLSAPPDRLGDLRVRPRGGGGTSSLEPGYPGLAELDARREEDPAREGRFHRARSARRTARSSPWCVSSGLPS